MKCIQNNSLSNYINWTILKICMVIDDDDHDD